LRKGGGELSVSFSVSLFVSLILCLIVFSSGNKAVSPATPQASNMIVSIPELEKALWISMRHLIDVGYLTARRL
jgi:hypothetical protein